MQNNNKNNKTSITSKQAIMNMMDANAYGNIYEDGLHKVRKTNNTSMMMQQFIKTIMAIHTWQQQNKWKATRASVSRRYNTPPLQEDLVPRSRVAPERKAEEEEVKQIAS